jgi:hypothetical protein
MTVTMKPQKPTPPTGAITLPVFARDLWEAMRSEAREQLAGAVSPEDFEASLPAWEELSRETRDAKIALARDELLKPLDRAGYQVRKKGNK